MKKWQIGIVALGLAACGSPELKVESDTSWSGFVGGDAGSSVDGSGNRTFDLNRGTTCWSFQKRTSAGRLRAYVEEPGIFGGGKKGDASTTAAFGVVSGCSD